MEYLQYYKKMIMKKMMLHLSFKPYYKWNTFNTIKINLLIYILLSFKPYYKWNTFNTNSNNMLVRSALLSFKPYYKWNTFNTIIKSYGVWRKFPMF